MIHITYSRAQEALAQEIRADLSHPNQIAGPLLIVLVSRESNTEPAVQAEIQRAQQERHSILPILTEDVALPPSLLGLRPLNFSQGYNPDSLRRRVAQLSMTPKDKRRANRQALAAIGAIVVLVFSIAIIAILNGWVAFPVAEYNEEATFQAQWIDGLIRETLEYVQPRAGEDALNFAATYEVAPTRLHFYIRGTATAIAQEG